MEALGKVRIGDALTLAGTIHLGTSEDGEKERVVVEFVIRQPRRTNSVGLISEGVLRVGYEVDRVEKNFGLQPLRVVAGKVLSVLYVMRIRLGTALVGFTVADRTDQLFEVESARGEMSGKSIEQGRMGSWVCHSHIVLRFDESDAEKVLPVAVYEHAGEEWILRRSKPVGHLVTRIFVYGNLKWFFAERGWFEVGLCVGVLHLGSAALVINDFFIGLFAFLPPDLGEESCEAIVVIL